MLLFPDVPPRDKTKKKRRRHALPALFTELFKPGVYLEYFRGEGAKAFKVFDRHRRPLGYLAGEIVHEADVRGAIVSIGRNLDEIRRLHRWQLSRKGIRALRGNDKFKRAYLEWFAAEQAKRQLTPCTPAAIVPAAVQIRKK